MSAWHAHQGGDDAGAAWRALSGDALPQPPQLSMPQVPAQPQPLPQQPQQPIHGGWQQPWQDETGQWHYPYGVHEPVQAPPYDPAAQHVVQPEPMQYATPAPVAAPVVDPEPITTSPIVDEQELAPVGPPRYLAPERVAMDPRRRTLAAVITFVSLLIALWAILGFMGAMSKTLTSVSSGTGKLELQLAEANKGLASLDEKTSHLGGMTEDTKRLATLLGTIDGDMGSMLENVDRIAAGMQSMDASLGTLETEVSAVNDINAGMAGKLGTIDRGLASQVKSVRTMRRDVQATGTVLGTLPGRLDATNKRLAHVNNSVNIMGCGGITNNLEVEIFLGPIRNGAAKVFATVIPAGAWGTKADGVTPC